MPMKNKRSLWRMAALCLALIWIAGMTVNMKNHRAGMLLLLLTYIGSPVAAFILTKMNGDPHAARIILLAVLLPVFVLPFLAMQKDHQTRTREKRAADLAKLKIDLKTVGASFNPGSQKKATVYSMMVAGNKFSKIVKTPALHSLLPPAYEDRDGDVRYAVVSVMGKLGGSEALALLEAALRDPVENVKQAAAKILGEMGRPIPENTVGRPSDLTKGLRPLGNKKRLTRTTEDVSYGYDVRLLLFRDRSGAEKYFDLFLNYARKNPPPFLIEIMSLYIPKTIYAEKYAVVIPNEQTDLRPQYRSWAIGAIRSCNESLRVQQSTDHKYQELHRYADAVLKWDILLPKDFSESSEEAKELLRDDPQEGFPALKLAGQEGVAEPPDKPIPQGPWIGVLFEIGRFEEALYGRAATALLFKIVGRQQLASSIIHGGDVVPECRYWCSAVKTTSLQQWELIEQAVLASADHHLAPKEFRFLKGSEVPVGTLPYQGFVSSDGAYVGV